MGGETKTGRWEKPRAAGALNRTGRSGPSHECADPARSFARCAPAVISAGEKNRGDRIRTCDLLVPNQALYQAKLHPVIELPPLSSGSSGNLGRRKISGKRGRKLRRHARLVRRSGPVVYPVFVERRLLCPRRGGPQGVPAPLRHAPRRLMSRRVSRPSAPSPGESWSRRRGASREAADPGATPG